MRHRAVLLGFLGLFFLFAAFRPALQTVAFLAGFVSVVSFLWLVWVGRRLQRSSCARFHG